MNNEEKILKETNKILNELAMGCHSFEDYKEQTQQYCDAVGLTAPSSKMLRGHFLPEMPSYFVLKRTFTCFLLWWQSRAS